MNRLGINDFNKSQQGMIKIICIHQLDSLRRLLHNESDTDMDITMYLIENEVTVDEFKEKIEENIIKFQKLTRNPDDLRVLDKSDLSKFRHILNNIEDNYSHKYPKAISNLWSRLFMIEEISNNSIEYSNLN